MAQKIIVDDEKGKPGLQPLAETEPIRGECSAHDAVFGDLTDEGPNYRNVPVPREAFVRRSLVQVNLMYFDRSDGKEPLP